MSESVRRGKAHVVSAELNKNNLRALAHQINAAILDKIDGHFKFREQFPDLIGQIKSSKIPS
jgi:hypothetical protein